jgi:hypothetical protein
MRQTDRRFNEQRLFACSSLPLQMTFLHVLSVCGDTHLACQTQKSGRKAEMSVHEVRPETVTLPVRPDAFVRLSLSLFVWCANNCNRTEKRMYQKAIKREMRIWSIYIKERDVRDEGETTVWVQFAFALNQAQQSNRLSLTCFFVFRRLSIFLVVKQLLADRGKSHSS